MDEEKDTADSGLLTAMMGVGFLDEPAPEQNKVEMVEDPDTGETKAVFKKLKPLTLREQMFVQEYTKDFNRDSVKKKFSMTGPQAVGMLARQHVKAAIHMRAMDIAKTADMDTNWVMRNLRDVVERCMDPEKFDPGCALRGLELVGKRFAMFTDRTEVAQTTIIRIESNVGMIQGMSGGTIDITPISKEIGHG